MHSTTFYFEFNDIGNDIMINILIFQSRKWIYILYIIAVVMNKLFIDQVINLIQWTCKLFSGKFYNEITVRKIFVSSNLKISKFKLVIWKHIPFINWASFVKSSLPRMLSSTCWNVSTAGEWAFNARDNLNSASLPSLSWREANSTMDSYWDFSDPGTKQEA